MSQNTNDGFLNWKRYRKYIVAITVGVLIVSCWDYIESHFNNWIEETTQGQSKSIENSNTNSPHSPPIIPQSKPATSNSLPDLSNPSEEKDSKEPIKKLKIITWNLYNIGISKDDEEISFIANLLKNFDILALQEISTKLSGPRAVVKLFEQLTRKGGQWEYVISDPTEGEGSERYAYLWRKDRVKLSGRPWLAKPLAKRVDREPFMARFKVEEKSVLLASFHAVPTAKKPAEEIIQLGQLHSSYYKDNLIVMGDFNLSQKHQAFEPLKKRGYLPVIENQKTSLKSKITKEGNYLAQEYDNIFYETKVLRTIRSGIIDFVGRFKTLKEARQISDHLPVWCEIEWKEEK